MLGELIGTEGVREVVVLRSRVAVMALHGGLEQGTYQLATAIADRAKASLYSVVQPDDFFWHVPSTAFDPAQSEQLSRILDHCTVAISLHGFGRPGLEDAVLLGGSNRDLARRIAATMRGAGLHAVHDIEAIPPGLRGLHPANPVNLPLCGGVQLELSASVRRRPASESIVTCVADTLRTLADLSSEEPAVPVG